MNEYGLAWQLACKGKFAMHPERNNPNWLRAADLLVTCTVHLHDGRGLPGYPVIGYGNTTNTATHDLRRYLQQMPDDAALWEHFFAQFLTGPDAEDNVIQHAAESREEYYKLCREANDKREQSAKHRPNEGVKNID